MRLGGGVRFQIPGAAVQHDVAMQCRPNHIASSPLCRPQIYTASFVVSGSMKVRHTSLPFYSQLMAHVYMYGVVWMFH